MFIFNKTSPKLYVQILETFENNVTVPEPIPERNGMRAIFQ